MSSPFTLDYNRIAHAGPLFGIGTSLLVDAYHLKVSVIPSNGTIFWTKVMFSLKRYIDIDI